MNTSSDTSSGDIDLPDGVPLEHHGNLVRVQMLREAGASPGRPLGPVRLMPGRPESPGGLSAEPPAEAPFRERLARMRDRYLGATAPPVNDEVREPLGLTAAMLRFQPAHQAPDESAREWQAVGTIELVRCLNEEPEWIDLLCLARRGSRYVVLPVELDSAQPEEANGAQDASRLVLHRVPGLDIEARQLREAFARKGGVLGAFTEAGLGVFVSIVFDLGG